jgi:Rad3-related DNA helicase
MYSVTAPLAIIFAVATRVGLSEAFGLDLVRALHQDISGSDKLRRLLWNRASGVILISATLTSCGIFDLFLQ